MFPKMIHLYFEERMDHRKRVQIKLSCIKTGQTKGENSVTFAQLYETWLQYNGALHRRYFTYLNRPINEDESKD